MGEDSLHGYRGNVRKKLEVAGIGIGDNLKVEIQGRIYEGSLMPRLKTADDQHILLKLKSGYNIGLLFHDDIKITKLGQAIRPKFSPSPLPPKKKDLPNVSIVSTGGTIASRVDYNTGGVYAAISSSDLLSIVPEISDFAAIDADILYSVFSENINTEHWKGMAETVRDKLKEGTEGVVITHGTDTMGYSAAALSFALQNIQIPVIFVGSQRSSDRPSSDAASNLIGVVKASGSAPFAEIVIGMHETTSDPAIVFHRGTKVRKCHTSARYAFLSVNSPPLARFVEGNIVMETNDYRRRGEGELKLMHNFEKAVALLKFHPGFKPEIIDYYVDDGYKGLIFEGTGLGHVSTNLYKSIENAIKQGLYIGMTSQCIWGRVNMNVYTTGRELQELGVVPLEDMLSETALVKLMWSLGNTENIDEVNDLMRRNIANEYSNRTLFPKRFN